MFNIDTILFEALGYKMSLLELLAVFTGLVSVWFAARANILTWLFALVNAVLFFVLFYQVNLYSAMALQVFFFCNALYGWYNWRRDSRGDNEACHFAAAQAPCIVACGNNGRDDSTRTQ